METIGIIGYGSMADMMVQKWLEKEVLNAHQIMIHTRSETDRLLQLKDRHQEINICSLNELSACDVLFICVPPLAVLDVLDQLPSAAKSVHTVSVAAAVTLDKLSKHTTQPISRYIPTLTSAVGTGVSLVAHGETAGEEEKARLHRLLSAFSIVREIEEDQFDAASNLTSSSPGFIAALFEEMAKAAVRNSELSLEEAYEFLTYALLGTGQVLVERGLTFAETVDRVATKGGITGEGAEVIQKQAPQMFDDLYTQTMKKYEQLKSQINEADKHH
ncbi:MULTISPECIES: pyrroline-5-carboxylate reductase ProG [Bacillus]|uniref:Pyrroline-5-carboxylate reductase n=1 Tax=Bacillus pumilus (strain SAFR-032) TaxID=315750 RepID=A8FCA0_BACP2|nr:pyrroline-5-carboxylate reductase ProG [Bacillus pumilus]MCP1148115.1 pyrroline-5-carboxylate reductase ProG [Bacillus sp. 1735sda2]ABV61867.1 pyrroline-5-carboxylate reductase [Bacillus pumilus SAFR-032]MBC3642576.1 pyrroline-5-carboxylate reductase [Bacillus pumilus]MBC3646741.1 pyrroline-5-carboxylate reductase [Bacillus pumilus]MBC3650381.1 pyrroline-5-carboxylate reductase [Bacillus pumilus]